MPSFINALLKLISSPSFILVNLKYVNSCFLCTLSGFSMDLISMITLFSTITSARNPSSNFMPSYSIGMCTCLSKNKPRFFKFVCKDHFINRLKQSRAKLGVDLIGGINHMLDDFVFGHTINFIVSRKVAKALSFHSLYSLLFFATWRLCVKSAYFYHSRSLSNSMGQV